jgi:hypothetical protein
MVYRGAIMTVTERGPIFQTGTCFNDSFGPIGIVTKVSADRLKGFVGAQTSAVDKITPIEDRQQLRMLIDIVRTGISELSRTGTTRLSIRSIVAEDLSEELAAAMCDSGARIEAAIPLKNGMERMRIVYIGYNEPSRRATPEELERTRAKISAAKLSALRKGPVEGSIVGGSIIEVVEDRALFSQNRTAETGPLVSMLGKGFGYSSDAAIGVLSDGRSIISIARENDEIIGIGVTESRRIPLANGVLLRTAEITDFYIRPEYRGNGYCSKMLRTLSDTTLKKMDVVFGEANSENQAMTNAVLRCGNELAGDGIKVTGILEKHAVVESSIRNLFVAYQP